MNLIEIASLGTQRAARTKFNFANPTFGTGIACNADPTAIAATEAMLVVDNAAISTSSSANKNVIGIVKRIALRCTAAGTGGTSVKLQFLLDKINRYSSGGTELTGNPTFIDTAAGYVAATPACKVYFGDITATAASAAKQVFSCNVKTAAAPCYTVGDTYIFDIEMGREGILNPTTTTATFPFRLPLIHIGRGSSLVVHPFATGATGAPSFEVEVETIELFQPRGT